MVTKPEDLVKKTTGVDASDAKGVTDVLQYVPGAIGNAAEFVGTGFGLGADAGKLGSGIEMLAARSGETYLSYLDKSSLLRAEVKGFEDGSQVTQRFGRTGSRVAGGAAGAFMGAKFGSAVPVVGTLIGGAIGGVVGTIATDGAMSKLWPEGGPSSQQLVEAGVEAQEPKEGESKGSVTPEMVLMVIGRKLDAREQKYVEECMAGGNLDGFGVESVENHLIPLLPKDFEFGCENACQYIAEKCNSGELDFGQLALDRDFMQFKAPRKHLNPLQAALDDRFEEHDGQYLSSHGLPPVTQGPGKGRNT